MAIEEAPVEVDLPVRRFTTEEFHRIIEAGVLGEDERVELIDGQIMLMLPIGDSHVACVDRLTYLFSRRLYLRDDPPAYVSVQNPVRLSKRDDLRPDVMLVRPEVQSEARAAQAGDVFLVVEVAATSLGYDRGPKLRRYALHGIPEVWIIALERERIYVYRSPAGEEYRMQQMWGRGDTLGIEALPEIGTFSVNEVLGPATS